MLVVLVVLAIIPTSNTRAQTYVFESTGAFLYGKACINLVVYNNALPNAVETVDKAVKWWAEVAPLAHYTATYQLEQRSINDLRRDDFRFITWYYGVNDPNEAWAKALEKHEEQKKNGCNTVFDILFLPLEARSWAAGVQGPYVIAFVKGYTQGELEAMITHEMGHIYGALDQYSEVRPTCTEKSGVLQVENQNANAPGGCLSNVNSIMKNPFTAYYYHWIDVYALGQVGYRDTDNDGIIDPVDTITNARTYTVYLPLVQ